MKIHPGVLRWCATILIALACPCAFSQIHIYSEARDKQGAAAKKAWGATDLDTVVATERANLATLLEAELQTQDMLATSVRDHYLRQMVGATVRDGLLVPIQKRYLQSFFTETTIADLEKIPPDKREAGRDELLQKVKAAVEAVEKAREKYNARQNKFRAWQPDYDKSALGTPSCASIADGATPEQFGKALASKTEGTADTAKLLLKELLTACEGITQDAGAEIYSAFGGEGAISQALARWSEEQKALIAELKALETAKKVYKEAADTYAKALGDTSADAEQKVRAAAKTLQEKLGSIETLQTSAGAQFVSQERLQSIQAMLKAIESSKDGKPGEGAGTAAVAFVIVPHLVDSGVKALAEARLPLALPLVLQRDLEQLQLEAASRDVKARKAQVDLSRQVVETLYQQTQELSFALRDLTREDKASSIDMPKHLSTRFSTVMEKASGDEKELLYGSATRYLDSLKRFDGRRYKLEYMRVAAIHERALAYTETNVKQWKSLIGTTVTQLSDFGASGIKPDDIARLINAAGVLWIGNGVNK